MRIAAIADVHGNRLAPLGMPGYGDRGSVPHVMEAGSPHARRAERHGHAALAHAVRTGRMPAAGAAPGREPGRPEDADGDADGDVHPQV